MRPYTSADDAASHIGVFAGGGAGPLGRGAKQCILMLLASIN